MVYRKKTDGSVILQNVCSVKNILQDEGGKCKGSV